MQVSVEIPVEAEAAAIAREVVVGALEEVPIPEDRVEDLRLLTSEVVTNSVRHAGLAPEDTIGVAVDVSERRIRVEVGDDGPASIRPPFPHLRRSGSEVGACTSSTGCRTAGASSGTIRTWCGSR